jgi:hypothetical protein
MAVALLTMCACHNNLDKGKLESSISDTCKSKGLALKSVTCPADRPVKEGDTFDCNGVTDDGDKLDFHVTQKDAQGNIDWKLTCAIIDASKIGDSIEEKVGKGADVKCAAKTIVMVKGKTIKCKATIEEKEHEVAITGTDDEGGVSWKIGD